MPPNKNSPMFEKLEVIFTRSKERKEFKESMNLLIEESTVGLKFILFTIISGMMAALGIMMENVTILIGAMLIAPLLIPLISLSVGIGAGSIKLINHSIKSLTVGLVLSLLSASLITLIIQPDIVDYQIYDSFNNILLYGLVALMAGVIGVYSWFKPKTGKIIPGVAIAVALVPPIAYAGIQLALAEQELLIDTLQLIFINLAGIFLAGLITFIAFAVFSKRPTAEVGKQVDEEVGKNGKK